jgi:hypothetical protein
MLPNSIILKILTLIVGSSPKKKTLRQDDEEWYGIVGSSVLFLPKEEKTDGNKAYMPAK